MQQPTHTQSWVIDKHNHSVNLTGGPGDHLVSLNDSQMNYIQCVTSKNIYIVLTKDKNGACPGKQNIFSHQSITFLAVRH